MYIQERYHHPESIWIKELVRYAHRLNPDAHQFKDYPFRKALIYLGEYTDESTRYTDHMPRIYPYTLDNGIVINEADYWLQSNTEFSEE